MSYDILDIMTTIVALSLLLPSASVIGISQDSKKKTSTKTQDYMFLAHLELVTRGTPLKYDLKVNLLCGCPCAKIRCPVKKVKVLLIGPGVLRILSCPECFVGVLELS